MKKGALPRLAGLLVVGLLVAGCDKCGKPMKFNAPTLPTTCGANADPVR